MWRLVIVWLVGKWALSEAVTIDNGVEGLPEISCGESFVGVRWQTKNTFEGHAFVKGRYGEPGCRTSETDAGKNQVEIRLPFTSCGLRRARSANPRGVFVSVTVVISFHPQLITKIDRAYLVQCFYMEAVKTVTAELEVSMLTTSLQTQTVPMPVCRYEVLDGGPNGATVKYAKIGDQVYHKWTCDTEAIDTFCMVVHSCTVEDGAGSNVSLLDPNGCALDKYLLGNLEYTGDLMAGKESHVFKYADRNNLYFNCQVSIGIREPGQQCPRPRCPEPQKGKRRKRDGPAPTIPDHQILANATGGNSTQNDSMSSEIIDLESEPIIVMDLDPKTERAPQRADDFILGNQQKSKNQTRRKREDDICLSMLGFSSYAALNATMTLLSISLFMAAYKRGKK